MGYITNFSGELTITPPVPWSTIRNSKFLRENAANSSGRGEWREVYLVVDEETVPTDEGDLVRKYATAIKATWEYEAKNYEIVTHLQMLLDEIGVDYARGVGFVVTGHFDADGEESGDIWRLTVVKDSTGRNIATVVKPKMFWPDDIVKLTEAINKIVREQRIKITKDVINELLGP